MAGHQFLVIRYGLQHLDAAHAWHEQIQEDDQRRLAGTHLCKATYAISGIQNGVATEVFQHSSHCQANINVIVYDENMRHRPPYLTDRLSGLLELYSTAPIRTWYWSDQRNAHMHYL